MKQLITLITILTILASVRPVFAALEQVPGVMAAPVVLYDEGSNILTDGQYHMMVAFKDSLGTTLFTEEQVVDVRNGVALISIGNGYAVGSSFTTSSGGLTASIFDVSTDISVEILVEGQTNSQELTILGSQPYAFIAQKAMTVADDSITASQIRDGTIHEEDLDEAFLESLQNSTVLVPNDEGGYDAIDLNASQVDVDSSIGLNNASGTKLDTVLQELDQAIETLRETDLGQSLDSVNTNLEDHSGASSGVHGVTGSVVGTTDSQSLQNKILDSTNSISGNAITSGTISDARVPAIGTHAATTSGVHGISGSVVGTSDAQTISNKSFGTGNTVTGNLSVSDGVTFDGVDVSSVAGQVNTNTANIAVDSASIADIASQVTTNTSNIATNTTAIQANTADISSLDTRVTAIELEPSFSENDISQSLKPFAYGTATMNSSGYAVSSCSGFNIDDGTTGSCAFTTQASDTSYTVVATASSAYDCNGTSYATSDWFRLSVDKTSGAAFNIAAYCTGPSSYNPTTVDFIIFYNH